jgi:hypothetical protein
MRLGIDDPWSHLSSVGYQGLSHGYAISRVYGMVTLVIKAMSHLVCSSRTLAFLTNMSEKRKSASPSAIQVKNRGKTIGTEEKLHVIS